jgi:hypothetical protein
MLYLDRNNLAKNLEEDLQPSRITKLNSIHYNSFNIGWCPQCTFFLFWVVMQRVFIAVYRNFVAANQLHVEGCSSLTRIISETLRGSLKTYVNS